MMRKQFAHSHEAQIRMGRCCATRTVAMENEKALRLNPTRELECSPVDYTCMHRVVAINLQCRRDVRGHWGERICWRANVDGLPVAVRHRGFSVSPINSIRGCSLFVVSGMGRMRATDSFALQSVCQMRLNGLIAGWCHSEHHIAKGVNIIRILSFGSCEESSNTRS